MVASLWSLTSLSVESHLTGARTGAPGRAGRLGGCSRGASSFEGRSRGVIHTALAGRCPRIVRHTWWFDRRLFSWCCRRCHYAKSAQSTLSSRTAWRSNFRGGSPPSRISACRSSIATRSPTAATCRSEARRRCRRPERAVPSGHKPDRQAEADHVDAKSTARKHLLRSPA